MGSGLILSEDDLTLPMRVGQDEPQGNDRPQGYEHRFDTLHGVVLRQLRE